MNQSQSNSNNFFCRSLQSLRLLQFEEAISFIDLAIDDGPKKEFYMFQKAKILFVANFFPQCALYIEENLIALYNHCSLYIFSQVLYYYQQSSKGSTISLYHLLIEKGIPFVLADEYISIYNKAAVDYFKKATTALEQCDYNICINYCNLITKEDNSSHSAYLLKGKCHHMLGEDDLAAEAYEQALVLNPYEASIYHSLGTIMIESKQYPKAIFYLQHATSLEPSNLIYHHLLAEAFFKWKKYDSALFHFKKVIDQDPGYIKALLGIADIYTMTNSPRNAKKYYTKVLKLQKPNYNSGHNKIPLTCCYTD